MLSKILQIVTPYEAPEKVCVMGNEAVARGAIEAGVRGVFAYPGTPSTEISEAFKHVSTFQNAPDRRKEFPKLTADPLYFEYSVNEKIALEKAIAYAIGNRNALCCMKNVGMNVASDALMTITYQTIGAGLVIIVCDDPGCYSSSNEQDSRYWGKMASVPLFCPATPEEARSMTKDAFRLSRELLLPVIVRMTTRVGHARNIVYYGPIDTGIQPPKFEKLPQHINIPARTAAAHKNLIDKLSGKVVTEALHQHAVSRLPEKQNGTKNKPVSLGIIASGVAAIYAHEILQSPEVRDRVGLLKLGLVHPFPADEVSNFLRQDFERILVLEELEPFIENEVRVLAQKRGLRIDILGKGFAGLEATGEYNIDIVSTALAAFTGLLLSAYNRSGLPCAEKYLESLPNRPPALCPGCPHRSTFYALKLAIPRRDSQIVLCGDIGCFGLGALPPLQMLDTIHHMGMSISMAQGLAEAFRSKPQGEKFVALVGDGTFFHSGVAGLLNAVYTRANVLVIIFDNRTIGMTGRQDHPGAPGQSKYREINLPALVKGMGVDYVETFNPLDLQDSFTKLSNALTHEGVAVVVAQSPCLLIPAVKANISKDSMIRVDHSLCNTCHNQKDHELYCAKITLPKSGLAKARAKQVAGEHIPAKEQACPANICNHGFFSAILAGDYKEALDIVRDKMLFAKVCGDICHKPCESLYRENGGPTVPIRQLKQFVSDIEENSRDFTIQKRRISNVEPKQQRIAVVGAGPAGLSAAYDLLQQGYAVKIFEKEDEAGGLLTYAIPDFRMDKKGCAAEIAQLKALGVEFQFNSCLGEDIDVSQLAEQFDALIIAIGMGVYPTLDVIENNVGETSKFTAVSFLRQYNLKSLAVKPASSIFVIGGGNSAIDAARTAKSLDPANEVMLSCIETLEEMPAFAEEIAHAKAEGVQLICNSNVTVCKTDADGRISISLDCFTEKSHLQELRCDYVITAIGQRGDETTVAGARLKLDSSNRIVTSAATGQTNLRNVFVAGDISAENHISLIGAIASGKKAAVGVRQLLENYDFAYEGHVALNRLNTSENNFASKPQKNGKFSALQVIEEMPAFELFQACEKCNHCIDNFGCPAMIKVNGQVEIDDQLCTRCGYCIDVCINDAIHWREVRADVLPLLPVEVLNGSSV